MLLNSLTKILTGSRKYKNILLCLLTVVLTVCINYFPSNSQTIPTQITSNANKQDNLSSQAIADMIGKVEGKWEKDYEKYFQEDFFSYSQTADDIADRLKEIRQKTGINPAVIWAATPADHLQLMLITPENQRVAKANYGADRVTLDKIVKQLHSAVVDPSQRYSTTYLPPAKLLYQWLIAPLETALQTEKIDTLLFCTGAGLRSLPLGVLYDGSNFLVEKYNIARIPAFSLTDTKYKPMNTKQVLAMGASEFADLPAIPGVEVELSTITPTLWAGTKILNQDFTVANLLSLHRQGKFSIVHLATHSQFNSGSPRDSFIQFFDRKVNLEQIRDLDLSQPLVDLLVLSSCETAVGNEEAEFGFAGLALQSGVRSAIASLWPIDDTGTVALMSEFYQNLRNTPTKAQALRKAQMAMLEGKIELEKGKLRGSNLEVTLPANFSNITKENLAHPYYWAGFTLIGNPW